MKFRNTFSLYSGSTFIAALTLITIQVLTQPSGLPDFWAEMLLSTCTIIWLAHHALRFVHQPATLIHAITLTLGLSIGIAPALATLTAGILIYALIDVFRFQSRRYSGWSRNPLILQWLTIWTRQVLANGLGLSLYFWLGGTLISGPTALPPVWPFLGCVLGFSLTYLTLHWLESILRHQARLSARETYALITITLAPAPVVLLAAMAFAFLGTASSVIYSVILVIAAPIFHSLTRMETQLRQRAVALGLLSKIASSITASYDPDEILDLIIESSVLIGCGNQALLHLYSDPGIQTEPSRSLKLSDELQAAWISHVAEDSTDQDPDRKPGTFFYDQYNDGDLPQELVLLLRKQGIVSLASLSLQTSHARLGRLTLFSSQPLTYSNGRRELLTLFAAQAAFALSNAQAHAFAGQTLSLQAEQLSRLEEINRQLTASSASDNLHEVILDHALQATAASWGYLALFRPETGALHLVARQGQEQETTSLADASQFSIDEGIFGLAFRTGQVLNIQHSSSEPDYVDPLGTNAESVLCVPVCGPESMLGVIGVESSRSQAFSTAHEQFLIQLAAYAANALYHAGIYRELQERLTEQSLLYQASTQIAESLESDAVGLAIADSLRVAVQSDIASVYRWQAQDQSLTLVAKIADGKPSTVTGHITPDTLHLLGHAQCILERVSMQWSTREELAAEERDYLIEQYGEGRLLLLPLCIGERTLGIVEIFRKDTRPFSNNAIRSAQSIAIQATIALENTDLFQRISESHNRLLAVLNSTREGILLINTDGKIVIANNQIEAMIGLKPEDLLQASINDASLDLASHLGYTQADLTQLAASLQKGQAQLTGVSTFDNPGGTGHTYHRIDAPVYDRTDQLIGWLISVRDISEQREIEETRTHLTEMIVHDLRSPLTAILNSLSLLRRSMEGDEPSSIAEQAFTVSDRSVNQMLGLVNSLLDISRLESGKLKISTEAVLIKPLMIELQERFQLEANSIGIILKTDYEVTETYGLIDREKIQRVLGNLLDNALKFTPTGGEVELGFTRKGDEIIFWVSDTGPGISPEFHQKIFERYIQIPGTTGRRRGTGLGLAFAKLAVEAHEGKLWVEESPSGGSVFKFSLPLVPGK
ncbi:MAG: GAF domain-containing protein [Anaerolineales bacterium]|nr:MAG: GAF domain-containing protein [Anaerolineales bacterium]